MIRKDGAWHFYLARTKGYGRGPLTSLVKLADLQRVDMGIAMCHFELAARETGMAGRWVADQPLSETTPAGWEYTTSWVS
jgi:hypothetical protein